MRNETPLTEAGRRYAVAHEAHYGAKNLSEAHLALTHLEPT